MVTDDPGTPGNGHWEINLAWMGEHDTGETTQDVPLLDMNYGVGERLQQKYEVPWLLVHDASATSRVGLGDSLAGVKWRFYDSGDPQRWQTSMYPQYEFNSVSRSYQRGIVEQGAHWDLPLEFQKSFGSVDINYEVGRTLRTQGTAEDVWFGGIVVGAAVDAATRSDAGTARNIRAQLRSQWCHFKQWLPVQARWANHRVGCCRKRDCGRRASILDRLSRSAVQFAIGAATQVQKALPIARIAMLNAKSSAAASVSSQTPDAIAAHMPECQRPEPPAPRAPRSGRLCAFRSSG